MAGARTSLWTRLWLVYGNDKSFPTTRGGLKGGEGEKSEFSLHCSIFFFSGLFYFQSFPFNEAIIPEVEGIDRMRLPI